MRHTERHQLLHKTTKVISPSHSNTLFTHPKGVIHDQYPPKRLTRRTLWPINNSTYNFPSATTFLPSLLQSGRGRGGSWGGSREQGCLESMSAPLLIRTLTESPRPGVGGQQAPVGPLRQTQELTVTFMCGHGMTIHREKPHGIWEILLRRKREKLPESVCQLHKKVKT